MTIPKSLIVAALLVGGATLAMAQNGPATGGEPPVAGGAAGNPAFMPANPGPGFNPGASFAIRSEGQPAQKSAGGYPPVGGPF
jgi:hypothetical protein